MVKSDNKTFNKNIKWDLISDDKRIKFDMSTVYSDDDGTASFGRIMFDGKKACDAKIVLPNEVFKRQHKPRTGGKMLSYALAYYLGLYIVNTVEHKNGNKNLKNSNKATNLALELLNFNDESSIRKGRKEYPIPVGAKIIVNIEPLGIIVLLENNKIEINDNGLSYKGRMWAWRHGDTKGVDGYGEINYS